MITTTTTTITITTATTIQVPFNTLQRQYQTIQGEIDAAIKDVFSSNRFILGEQVKAFEAEFASYIGVNHAIGVNSGTDALVLALAAVGIKQGDEVITVPNTAIPTVAAICLVGAKPVFVDINEDDYLINTCEEQLSKAITPRTKAIIPVHLYGQACAMDKIIAFAKQHKVMVIEDCAQAHGAKWEGKCVGSWGDVGCFSFYPTKNLGAYGDAGMVVTNDAILAEKVRKLREYGQEKKYHTVINGYNSRLDELQASILRKKLKHLDQWNEKRRAIAKQYISGITNQLIILPQMPQQQEQHVFHLFVVRCKQREQFRDYLNNKGIGTDIHYPLPLHLQEAYKYLGYHVGDFPIAEFITPEIVSLPFFPELTTEEITYIIQTINAFKPT